MNTGFYRVAASSPEIYLGDCVNNADNIIVTCKKGCAACGFSGAVYYGI